MGAEPRGALGEQQRRLAGFARDDDAHRRALEFARLQRRVREPREVFRQAGAQRCVERDLSHAGTRARIEASATPARISSTPAKWYQYGRSPRNAAARMTAIAGIRCMVAPARAAPMRFTT